MFRIPNLMKVTLALVILVALGAVLVLLFGSQAGLPGTPVTQASPTPLSYPPPASPTAPAPTTTPQATRSVLWTPTPRGPGLSVARIQIIGRKQFPIPADLHDNDYEQFTAASLSPDGKQLLLKRNTGVYSLRCWKGATGTGCFMPILELWIMDADTGSLKRIADRAGEGSWSPDGSRIAYLHQPDSSRWEVWTMKADGSEKTKVVEDVYWAPTGWLNDHTLVYGDWEGRVMAISLDGTQSREIGRTRFLPVRSGAFAYSLSPDGRRLVIVVDQVTLWLETLDAPGEPRELTEGSGHYLQFSGIIGGLAWSPDSSRFAYTTDGSIRVFDAEGHLIADVRGEGMYPRLLVWSPDSRVLAFAEDDLSQPQLCDVYIADADGTGVKRLTDTSGKRRDTLAWILGGTRLIYDDDQDSLCFFEFSIQ